MLESSNLTLEASGFVQGKPGEAVKLMRRGIAIKEKNLPPDHPTLPSSLNNLAEFLKAQVRLVARPIPKTRGAFLLFSKRPQMAEACVRVTSVLVLH